MDTIDWIMGIMISAFTALILIVTIFIATYVINPTRYESIQHNNNIEITQKGD